ncbi:hypothetical protein FEM48_Zijuj09G0216500 [Ziziphus jujuba var. spinosa]|uniref:Uncharacterized protein n=1 Tax=Ziziphus jujuba var. spinosa TaxID=714518 RepID=A0A978UVG5_ZIZJJ|nr:hypothetical protein FEM48_Zijuj09G0216500 [Ziziphus jujuba var. spinosa]
MADLLGPSTGSSLRTKENAVSGLVNLGRCGHVSIQSIYLQEIRRKLLTIESGSSKEKGHDAWHEWHGATLGHTILANGVRPKAAV